jgi:hypothetical protein
VAFARISKGASRPTDPFDDLSRELRGRPTEAAFPEGHPRTPAEPKWSPPEGATTFATLGRSEADRAAAARRHVIVREDPMFGRRGYVREVIPDADHGFLILVIVFAIRKRSDEPWKEYHNPPPDARRYWRPDKVEALAIE